MMTTTEFTPTQRRLLKVLADGEPHTRKELWACISDELGGSSLLRYHMCKLRARLKLRGETVVCEMVRQRICYRHVRVIDSQAEN